MPESLALVTALAGFGLVIAAGARLGAGSHLSLGGLVPAQGRSDWPRGVQESDVPRFAVAHADALRPDATPATTLTTAPSATSEALEPAEIVELYDRPLCLDGRHRLVPSTLRSHQELDSDE